MLPLTDAIASMEAIQFQKNALLFQDLRIAFETILSSKSYTTKKAGHVVDIASIVKKHTGLNVKFNVAKDSDPNAFVFPPSLRKDHVLVPEAYREYYTDKDALKLMRKTDGILKGEVQLDKSRVTGVFTELKIMTYVTSGILKHPDFTGAMIAAIYLHELGHIFTYFEFLRSNLTLNYVLSVTSGAVLGTTDSTVRVRLIKEACKTLDVKNVDAEALSSATSKEAIESVILKRHVEDRKSELGTDIYDFNGWETLSDQFAVRHGAGRDLAIAMDKLNRWYGDNHLYGNIRFYLVEVIKILATVARIILAPLMAILVCIMIGNPHVQLYPDSKDRLRRMRNQLIERTKAALEDGDLKAELVQDVKVVERIMEDYTKRTTLYEGLWKLLSPNTRRQVEQKELQQDLEDLAANQLFLKAAELETLRIA